MPSNIPNRSVNYVQLNTTKLLNTPLSVFEHASGGGGDWWKPICKLAPRSSVNNGGGVNLTGSLGGFYADQTSHIDLTIENREYGETDPEEIRVIGTYKTRQSTSGLNTDSVPQRSIEVRKVTGEPNEYIVYARGYTHSKFDLRATMYRTFNANDYTEWLWDENEAVLTEEPEGEVVWDLLKDMSPTPDMKRVADYITNPQNDNYAQQLLPRYDSTPESPIDLNDYMTPGVYKSQNNSQTTQYVINKPAGLVSGFILNVYIDKGMLASAEQWRIQELMCDIGIWRRYLDGSTGVWTDWIRTDLNAIQAGTNITKTIDAQGRVVLDATGMTRQQILDTLGYTEIPISKTDENNNTVTVYVLGRTS